MSTSTYHVETVNSSIDCTGAMADLRDSRSPHCHHTVNSSAFQEQLPSTLSHPAVRPCQPQLIATISAGFEKGDYLIREERGSNIYFDFFEEAYNYACQKGFARMSKSEETEFMEIIKLAHKSVPGGCRFNTGRLLMVLRKRLVPVKVHPEEDEPLGPIMDDEPSSTDNSHSSSQGTKKKTSSKQSTNTLSTDAESNPSHPSYSSSSYVDSWE